MRRRRRDQRGFIANRGIGFGLAGLALVACGFGLPGHGGGTDVTSPTTTLPSTTTVATTTTTATTVPSTTTTATSTTTTTIPGGDPCAAEHPGIPGFPCTVNTGVHGVTFTAANTTANNGTSCTVCPTGMTYSGGSYNINSCVTINGWKITGQVNVLASNGHKQVYTTEGAAVIGACVKLTHVLIVPPEPGKVGDVGLDTGFSSFSLDCTFGGAPATCGPVYFADSEISMSHPNSPGTCGTGSNGPIACNSGFSYAMSNTNLHLWRAYLHGTMQGIDSDGYSEVHDSYLRADRSDQKTIDAGGAQAYSGHGDAYFQRNGPAPWMLVDHSSLFCGAQSLDCNRDGAYVNDEAAPNGGIIQNNLFMASTGVFFCFSSGDDQSGANKPFPFGSNLVIKNNVFGKGPGTEPCQHNNSVDDWNPTVAASHNNKWCNNRLSDGSFVNAAWETGGCP